MSIVRPKIFILICLFISFKFFAQEGNINKFKYVIIPKTYGFLGEEDKYQLNSLTKFLFNKYGYKAFFENESLPEDLRNDGCKALIANVKEVKGGVFKTKIQIDLKDCKGSVVYSSRVGETREKEYAKAYNLALRDAFETYRHYNYKYAPDAENDIKHQISEAKTVFKTEPIVESKAQKNVASSKLSESKKGTENHILYAQPISKGYQVVDTTPKVVMVLLQTGKQDVFIVKEESAVVYKEDGFWYYSKNDGIDNSVRVLNIKF